MPPIVESHSPKGVPSPDPETFMTTAQLVDKFRRKVEGVISDANTERVVDALLSLEDVDDVGQVLRRLTPLTTP
jgi:hypothetical protein